MSKLFYRFRSVANLLDGHNELEKQTIYFASPEQLNDPMEGNRDIFWSGDIVVWENLFTHYLFCLERLTITLLISGEEYPITENDIPVFGSTEDFPTDLYKQRFENIKNRFLQHSDVSRFITLISSRSTPVREDELGFYLDCIHQPALKAIFDANIENNLSPESNRLNDDCYAYLHTLVSTNFIGMLEKSIASGEAEDSIIKKIFIEKTHMKEELYLLNKHKGIIDNDKKNRNLVINEFSSCYLRRLKELTFPKWYTACFMTECKNSSVWGHYGDNHKGMCLIFDSEIIEDKFYISLNGITGWGSSGAIYGKKPMAFHQIEYEEGFGEIDFFRSIGSLPMPVLNKMWYMGKNGNHSSCAHEMNIDVDAWRANYWSNFIRDITVKSNDWKYEKESRLILQSSITDLSEKDRRTLTYDFASLKGIIFGINTREEDKLKVMKIIERKCLENSRNEFKFYQAYYSPDDNCIENVEMSLVKFFTNEQSKSK